MRSSSAGPRLLALVVLMAAPLLAACGESDPDRRGRGSCDTVT